MAIYISLKFIEINYYDESGYKRVAIWNIKDRSNEQ